jgi:hypothetical protein
MQRDDSHMNLGLRKDNCYSSALVARCLPAIVCLFVRFNQAIHGDRMSRPERVT